MRIVSLLPSATEIVYALGLGDQLVGVTHECDFPADVRSRPIVTRSLLDHSAADSAEIDQAVSSQLSARLSLYELDAELLAALRPDLILTQALCEVCAVAYQAVCDVTATFAGVAPSILSLEPNSLDDILSIIVTVGAATGAVQPAAALVEQLQTRIMRVRSQTGQALRRPRVACLEWIDPLFGPGHWLPGMISLAGGEPGLGQAGQDSQRIPWSDVIAFAPEVVIVTPCGFTLPQAVSEALRVLPSRAGWEALPAVRSGQVYAVDGNAYFSRPGPRIVDSLELLAELIQPDLCAGWGVPDAWTRLGVQATALPATIP